MANLPTLVFVPGAWHRPTCYDKIIKLLREEHGLKCTAITLPSTTGNPEATFKDDIDAARDAISGETTQGRDVVVVVHSYGGMVGNSAVKGFAKPRGAAPDSSTGHVIGIILIASGYTLTGFAFMDPFFGIPPPQWRINKETGFADIVMPPRQFFYHDLPADEAEYWTSQLTTQSLKALFEGGQYAYAGWLDVPSWYIGTIEDRGMPVVAQRLTVGMAREMGGHIEHRELPTSHSPFLSRPKETVEIMVDAIGAFTGKSLAKAPKTSVTSKLITTPAARLWRPVTWYRYGLPLAFGHIIGRGMLAFGGVRRMWRSMFR